MSRFFIGLKPLAKIFQDRFHARAHLNCLPMSAAPLPSGKHERPAGRYADVRRATEALVAHLSPEDLMLQSMPDTSPAKWHLAHTTWFFETFVLRAFDPAYRAYDDRYRQIFNSYYKQVGDHPQRAQRSLFSRPSFEEVMQFRCHVDERMIALLELDDDPKLHELVEIGINHEQQHQELIVTDIKHAFWMQPLRPIYLPQSQQRPSQRQVKKWTSHSGGVVEIGHSGSTFCFDNELPRHKIYLQPFRVNASLVTNGDYLRFMRDGGYKNPALWLSDGWDTVCREQWSSPLYWEHDAGGWQSFTTSGMQPVNDDEPVCHISYYEADAFARWAGARLPNESEWEIIADPQPIDGNFSESRLFRPIENGDHWFGNVWQWTASPYVAYPGYMPASGALGEYNGKFMCNQFVLRGGSCATPSSHIRATYRNFFPPHARWQFTGLRLANDAA